MIKHYHVLSGDHGYMPDYNCVYATKAAAQDGMVWWRRDCEDAISQALECLPADERKDYPPPAGRFFSGSVGAGYYECLVPTSIAGLEYIELTECQEEDCMEDLDL